jgi:heme A synthase
MPMESGPVEAKLSTAAAILTAAAALGGAIIVYFPLEKFARLPPDLIADSRFFTGFICLFAIIGIAAASYSTYPKSRRLTLYLAMAIFAAGLAGIIGLRIVAAQWVAYEADCLVQEYQMAVIAPIEPASVAAASATLALKGDYLERAGDLICSEADGETVRNDFAESNSARRATLMFLLISSFTCLFSSMTLLLWSLAALQPIARRGRGGPIAPSN